MKLDLESEATPPYSPDESHRRLARLAGSWKGTAKTMADPASPPVEAAWEGNVALLLGGRFARFTYRSSYGDKPIAGELTLAFESGEKLWRTSWIDSFHTGSTILVSEGAPSAGPISVRGRYFAAEGHPHWGWRTEVDDATPDALALRMFNIEPEREEALGVEVILRRA